MENCFTLLKEKKKKETMKLYVQVSKQEITDTTPSQ